MIFIKNIAVKIVSFVIGIYISNTTLKQTIKGTIAEDEYKRTQRYIVTRKSNNTNCQKAKSLFWFYIAYLNGVAGGCYGLQSEDTHRRNMNITKSPGAKNL